MRRGFVSAATLVALSLVWPARAEDAPAPGEKPDGKKPRERRPVCLVEITHAGGLRSRAVLLGFEEGVYQLRIRGGDETEDIELPEDEVESVKFTPFRKPDRRVADLRWRGPDARGDRRHGRPDDDERRRAMRDLWWRLADMRREGRLGGHIHGLESRLREAGNKEDAVKLLVEIGMASGMNGEPLDGEGLQKLVRSIEDPKVRAERLRAVTELARRIEDILDRLQRAGRPHPRFRDPGRRRGSGRPRPSEDRPPRPADRRGPRP